MINKLKINQENLILYYAGFPDFLRNFSRDNLISGLLMNNYKLLKDQLIFCCVHQGRKNNPHTGEEIGKIHHEYPGVELEGLSTEYNACDTNALFCIAFEKYLQLTKDKDFLNKYKKNIELAVKYILSHLDKNYLFYESPKFCGAERFALRCTYWKDSQVIGRKDNNIEYPVIYPLIHIYNIAGLRAAAKILERKDLLNISENMREKLPDLFDKKTGMFYIAIDKKGKISAINSDSLHALYFLEKDDLNKEQIKGIVRSSVYLETPAGYIALDKNFKFSLIKDSTYNFQNMVFPFEQALINFGAKKLKLKKIEEVSSRVKKYLKTAPENLIIQDNFIKKEGCDPQLWTIAAKYYFKQEKSS